jgi:hypothetical protein
MPNTWAANHSPLLGGGEGEGVGRTFEAQQDMYFSRCYSTYIFLLTLLDKLF